MDGQHVVVAAARQLLPAQRPLQAAHLLCAAVAVVVAAAGGELPWAPTAFNPPMDGRVDLHCPHSLGPAYGTPTTPLSPSRYN